MEKRRDQGGFLYLLAAVYMSFATYIYAQWRFKKPSTYTVSDCPCSLYPVTPTLFRDFIVMKSTNSNVQRRDHLNNFLYVVAATQLIAIETCYPPYLNFNFPPSFSYHYFRIYCIAHFDHLNIAFCTIYTDHQCMLHVYQWRSTDHL